MTSDHMQSLQPRKITGINLVGLQTLVKREVGRFLSVYLQTIAAPVITTLLYYTIFAVAFGGIAREIDGIPFLEFLAPGLIMMSMVQNAFSNTSSSLIISKIQGNIVDILLPPLSNLEIMIGFITGSLCRGIVIGVCTYAVMAFFVDIPVRNIWIVMAYAILGNVMLGALGMLGGIWAEKFDHIAVITNFIVTPLTFLSGTFYSMKSLPEMWQAIALFNPFFYMIDGFRAGFIENPASHVWQGLWILLIINAALLFLILQMLRTGYKIKS